MSLRDEAKKMNSGKGISFMEGRERGSIDELLGKTVTIRDYAFLEGQDGEYAVFIIDEDKDSFFFGGSVLTENLKNLSAEAKIECQNEGLPTLMEKRQSKKTKRTYTSVEFFPDEEDDLPF